VGGHQSVNNRRIGKQVSTSLELSLSHVERREKLKVLHNYHLLSPPPSLFITIATISFKLTSMTNSSLEATNNDTVMIALYYWYTPIPKAELEPHKEFHEHLCETLDLNGRIRISKEGLNGVLSGKRCDLEQYSLQLQQEVQYLHSCQQTASSSTLVEASPQPLESPNYPSELAKEKRYGNTLDIKYCHLRKDIDIEKQLFTYLHVKITQEVVSLNETEGAQAQTSSRSRRRKGKARKQKTLQDKHVSSNISYHNTSPHGQCQDSYKIDAEGVSIGVEGDTQSHRSDAKTRTKTNLDLDNYQPALHLTPQQWNDKLLQDAQSNGIDTSHANGDANAILIDARNIYESNIGHFAVPGIPTLLANTRKYSTIPSVLQASIPILSGKNVYMYCTGGVRCEKASVYLRALSESSEWPEGMEKPKSIYQLQGGIQKYLEQYGQRENGSEHAHELNGDQDRGEKQSDFDQGQDHQETLIKKDDSCLFAGKNFVFDNRRYDPVLGNSEIKIVGKCVMCSNPHDDYDNGNAPCENKEARCCRCRVLVLVCHDCRNKVRIWGEDIDKSMQELCRKPDLYCGGSDDKQCINEGHEVQHCELRQY